MGIKIEKRYRKFYLNILKLLRLPFIMYAIFFDVIIDGNVIIFLIVRESFWMHLSICLWRLSEYVISFLIIKNGNCYIKKILAHKAFDDNSKHC